jgi:hypothetical protein
MFHSLMTQVCKYLRTTFWVHPDAVDAVMLGIINVSPRSSLWYFRKGDPLYKNAALNSAPEDGYKYPTFVGYEGQHFWRMDDKDLEESKDDLLHVITSPLKSVYQARRHPNGAQILNTHLFFVLSSGPHSISIHDDIMVVFHKSMIADVHKDRSGVFAGTNGRFPIKSREWNAAKQPDQPKPDDVNSILEKLYDARFRKKPHDIPALLKRYTEITGKKQPEFMS